MKENLIITIRIAAAGIIGGLAGNGISGVLFTLPPVQSVLYNPALQSAVFLQITPLRDIPLSVAGLVALSIIHAGLFSILLPGIPGKTWIAKGIFFGIVIWSMFWVFQEWFVYHTLLGEPLLLNVLELALLLPGTIIEGMIISGILAGK
jgi:hypothetical protein